MNIKENIKTSVKECTGLYELKLHKLLFDEEYFGFLDQRQQFKMQWVKDPRQSNVDNLNTVRRKVSKQFKNKRRHVRKLILRNLKLTVR